MGFRGGDVSGLQGLEHADVACEGKVEYASGQGGAMQMEEEEEKFTCFFRLVTLMLVMF